MVDIFTEAIIDGMRGALRDARIVGPKIVDPNPASVSFWDIPSVKRESVQNVETQSPIRLRVLGFSNSGKSQFINALRNISNPHQCKNPTIGVSTIPPFAFTRLMPNDHGKCNYIGVKDIEGSENILMENAKKFVADASILLIMCNVDDYLVDKNHIRKKYNQLLRALYTMEERAYRQQRYLILTHADLVTSEELEDVVEEIGKNYYSSFMNGKIIKVNACNQRKVRDCFCYILEDFYREMIMLEMSKVINIIG